MYTTLYNTEGAMAIGFAISRSIPSWVTESVFRACGPLAVKQSQIVESPRSGRWDILVELANGTEVLAWVDGFDQTPTAVEGILRQALQDAGVA
jgi:hypothetical protein